MNRMFGDMIALGAVGGAQMLQQEDAKEAAKIALAQEVLFRREVAVMGVLKVLIQVEGIDVMLGAHFLIHSETVQDSYPLVKGSC